MASVPNPALFFTACVGVLAVAATNSTSSSQQQQRPWDREFYSGASQLLSQLHQPPTSYCRITNVYFQTAQKTFYAGLESSEGFDRCSGLREIWTFDVKNNDSNSKDNAVSNDNFRCDQVFQTGHVFMLHYSPGSNYFHLHYNTFLPLFATLHDGRKPAERPSKNVVLMPSVETARGQGTDWTTDAFLDDTSYWMEILKVVAGPYHILPLDRRLAAMQKTMCFKEVLYGNPKVNSTNSEFIQSFVKFVKSRFDIPHFPTAQTSKPVVGIILRSGQRKKEDEEPLVRMLEPFGELEFINLEGLPFKTQVERVQRYTVLMGFTGAGLKNALYLPPTSVAIQLILNETTINFDEYAQFLQSRGPYLEWRIPSTNLTNPTNDELQNLSSHLEGFKDVIEWALFLVNMSSSKALDMQ